MATAGSPIRIGTTAQGDCLIQIVDRATMHHSPSTEQLVVQTLERDPNVSVIIDLTGTTYLDSTFLGCIFGLHRRFIQRKELPSAGQKPRLRIHASPAKLHELYGPLRLDKLIQADPNPAPRPVGATVPMPESPTDHSTICRHVMDCHRRLAEADSPAKAAFVKIADAMERELKEGRL
jgi:anti-anti-sigma regulatory factor